MIGLAAGLLFGLLIPVAIVMGIVTAVSRARRDDGIDEPGIGTVRRLFLYGLTFVSLMLAGSGVAMLAGGALEALAGDLVIADDDSSLAVALALTVVGLPAWAIFGLLAQRTVREHPVEHRSEVRWLYLSLARGVALVIVVVNLVDLGEALLGADDFSGHDAGWAATWALVWLLHHAIAGAHAATSEATRFLDRLYAYFGAVLGLYVLGWGLVTVIEEPASRAYDSIFRPALVDTGWTEAFREGLVLMAVGGAAWWWHWLAGVRREPTSMLWHVYVFLFGILAAVAVAVPAAGAILYRMLEWALGAVDRGDPAVHFAGVVTPLALLVAGVASWVYHRMVLEERAAEAARRSEPERIYRYLVAAAGLLTLAAGLTSMFALTIELIVPAEDLFRADGWWRDQLAVTLTLLLVGGPLWARYWTAAQRRVAPDALDHSGAGPTTDAHAAEERASLSRRTFVFGVVGVAVFTVLVNLAVLLYEFFDALLDGTFEAQVLVDTRWSIALLLTAGAVAAYYWLVLREDQGATPAAEATRVLVLREVILVAPSRAAALVAPRIEAHGVRVRRWRRPDLDADDHAGEPPEKALDVLLERLLAVEHPRVLAVLGSDGLAEIVPFEVDAGG